LAAGAKRKAGFLYTAKRGFAGRQHFKATAKPKTLLRESANPLFAAGNVDDFAAFTGLEHAQRDDFPHLPVLAEIESQFLLYLSERLGYRALPNL
jgi:hypothetical protein